MSRGADAANLIAVALVVVALVTASRGSLTGLLIWLGGLFYLAYAVVPYLIGAPFTAVLLAQVVAFIAAAYAVIALALEIDGAALAEHFASAPARAVGALAK